MHYNAHGAPQDRHARDAYKFVDIAGISPKKAAIKNCVQALETFGGFRTGIVCAYQKLSSW
ncbi:hypothetical protein HN018_22495 (plasmid) [Lichenicola cladoniae]|uniref:Uncharacterized protein n=1 Tax=Lichenicola cladoniae TaxID=1484109 RepID=A0A6M8HY10_9PROT|nr:hypothetical protein [Lichenicola cladoniae]NPD68200.1 hypothetical protein [Acetobacteraceae bacterium]QKE92981.1 hypothetical protein HN018_22495 [Lichenicola cladoniae]